MQLVTAACPKCQAPINIEVTATYGDETETAHGLIIQVNMQFDPEQPSIQAHKLECGDLSK